MNDHLFLSILLMIIFIKVFYFNPRHEQFDTKKGCKTYIHNSIQQKKNDQLANERVQAIVGSVLIPAQMKQIYENKANLFSDVPRVHALTDRIQDNVNYTYKNYSDSHHLDKHTVGKSLQSNKMRRIENILNDTPIEMVEGY